MTFKSKKNYWIAQAAGWTGFILLNLLFTGAFATGSALAVTSVVISGIFGFALTHAFRWVFLKLHWFSKRIWATFPRLVVASFALAFLHLLFLRILLQVNDPHHTPLNAFDNLSDLLNLSVVYVLWSMIYAAAHFIENYKVAEINKFKLEALHTEAELTKLRSQLNPHFMFNSLNSIRALVKEDPDKAKIAITQLSSLLRSSLATGSKQLVPFQDELLMVKDYLSLEQIRFEERLTVSLDISPDTLRAMVPPLMVQTLVENAIKHGIGKLPEGGVVKVFAAIEQQVLRLSVANSGTLSGEASDSGYGLSNTQERLQLLFGKEARLNVVQLSAGIVEATLKLPVKQAQ